jgi:small subunit ribosomal protein S17
MGRKKEYLGTVIGDKMAKTCVVRVVRKIKHPKYNRIIKTYNKFKAHDEKNEANVGDEVVIRQTRPLSKDKFFRLVSIVKKAQGSTVEINDEVK